MTERPDVTELAKAIADFLVDEMIDDGTFPKDGPRGWSEAAARVYFEGKLENRLTALTQQHAAEQPDATNMEKAIAEVVAERKRQIEQEGWELFERYFIAQRDDLAQQHAAEIEARDLRISQLETECGHLQADVAELRDQLAAVEAERDECKNLNGEDEEYIGIAEGEVGKMLEHIAAAEAERDSLLPLAELGRRTKSWLDLGGAVDPNNAAYPGMCRAAEKVENLTHDRTGKTNRRQHPGRRPPRED